MQIRTQIEAAIVEFKRYAFSRTAQQTGILYASQILFIALGIVTSSLNTRILGPKDYGVLAFFGTITGFSVLFFRFGLFSSGGLLLAKEKEEERERELIGALTLVGLGVGFSFSLFIFIFSFFVDRVFHTEVDYIFRILSPLLIAMPFQLLIPQISRGTNKIVHLAWFNLLPKALYVAALVTLLLAHFAVNVVTLILLNLFAANIVIAVIICSFKPSFDHLRSSLKRVWAKNKEYGIHLYWGQIADQSTYKLDGIFVSYFVNTTQLGFYSLANALTSPLAMLSQSLSTSLFKGFAHKDRIPEKVIQLNFLWLITGVVGLVGLGKYIVALLFGIKFLPVASLIWPLALASFFRGMYQPYNAFLGAKGKGVWMRNMSIIMAATNLIGNIALIPTLGAYGAAMASVLGNLSFYISCLFYYTVYRKGMQ